MGVYYLEEENLWFDDVNSPKVGGSGAASRSQAQATIRFISSTASKYINKTITINIPAGPLSTDVIEKKFGFSNEPYISTGDNYDNVIYTSIRFGSTVSDIAQEFAKAIQGVSGFGEKIKVSLTLGSPAIIVLTQSIGGDVGNTNITTDLTDSSVLTFTNFIGGGQKSSGGPILRIGIEVVQQEVLPGAVTNPIDEGNRIGKVTLFGDNQNISYLEGYVQGKNIKNMQQFFKMNIPHIRANNCQYYKSQRLSGELDHKLSLTRDIALGQNDNLRRVLRYTPFNDRLIPLYDPVAYITAGNYILGYPIVTDNSVDFENYNDPDALEASFAGGFFRDGIIEPLGIRDTFANPNTGNTNIMIKGIKGSFMPYHQEQGDWSDSKGSAVLDNKFEFKQGKYDWFEDSQDLALPENVFARIGDQSMTTNNNFMSLWGYVSDGTYDIAPFVDLSVDNIYFKNKYRQLSPSGAIQLLSNSSRTLSTIGTRFKSSNSGVILSPKYDSINQNVFGTDSIAFSGLMRG
jgi:hypothetical protein